MRTFHNHRHSITGIFKPKFTQEGRSEDSYEVFFEPNYNYIRKFIVDSEQCPIVEYKLYKKVRVTNATGFELGGTRDFEYNTYEPFTNPSNSTNGVRLLGDNGFDGLLVSTEFPFEYKDLYIRAATQS